MVIKFQQQQKSAFKREKIIVEKWLINLNMRKIIPFKEQQKSLKALYFFDLFFFVKKNNMIWILFIK